MGHEDDDGNLFEVDTLAREIRSCDQDHFWNFSSACHLILDGIGRACLCSVHLLAFTTSEECVIRDEVRYDSFLENVPAKGEF